MMMMMETLYADNELVAQQHEANGSIRKGCDPFAQTQRSKLQHRRARINQQINKELRMRAGAENLYRASTNQKVRETVALELSFVNSNLQLLKEELAELNSSMEVYQNESEILSVPMIPLGLKETKELDLTDPIKAMRTPSRNEAGIELLMEYYNQLYFLDNRFFPPGRNLGVLFHWYDSLTGVPCCQRSLAFEKGSVLFNMGALYTQIGARQDRQSVHGVDMAIHAFQKAAGCFNYLKENFSNAPSLDMSAASLNMLLRLMVAQIQECIFHKFTLESPESSFLTQVQTAREAAKVEDVYTLVHRTMAHPPVKDYVPFSWTAMVRVKAEHFKALSHFHAACALCDFSASTESEMEEHEKAFLQFHVSPTEGPSVSFLLRDQEERRKLGKAHLKKAIMKHEEAMRVHGLCKILRKMDILQEVLTVANKGSLSKYSDIDHEEDFFDIAEAPDVEPLIQQRPEIKSPMFSEVKVTDLFHRLGPLSVFSAKHKWCPAQNIHLERGEEGFGFTLRGDSPVLIAGVVPAGCATCAGVKPGSYIVSVNGIDCRWSRHAEVVQLLKTSGRDGVDIEVVTILNPDTQSTAVDKKSSILSTSELLKGNKENSRKSTSDTKGASTRLLWNKKRAPIKRDLNVGSSQLPFSAVQNSESMY
uniref:Rhophilin Rho GTPase binding protein 1 n=1 Tax=Leptobrachium leishanense TaxID=445787 RepID=A0A8C5PIM9_9ANUR